MLYLVTQKGKERRIMAKFEDSEVTTAVDMASDLVKKNSVSCMIYLGNSNGGKPLLLKKVGKDWRGKVKVI